MRIREMVLATIWTVAAVSGAEVERPVITVLVHDYAGVPRKTLIGAAQEAQRIFRQVGIDSEWVICASSGDKAARCETPAGPADKILNIIPQSMEQGLPRPDGVFGVATLAEDARRGVLAYVFYSRVFCEVIRGRWSLSRLMGHVMAHEVGHLLLGKAHSADGIMRGDWGLTTLDMIAHCKLGFSAEQGQRLQAEFRALVGMPNADSNGTLYAAR